MKKALLSYLFFGTFFCLGQNTVKKVYLKPDYQNRNTIYPSFIKPGFNLDVNSKKHINQKTSQVNSLICFKDSTYTWEWDTLSNGWATLPFSKATYLIMLMVT